MQKFRLVIAATLALAACDSGNRGDQDRGDIDNATIADRATDDNPPERDETPTDAPGDNANIPGPADSAIPAAFHGRWGMVPKDCGPDAAIAKGLMTIDGRQLRFYESVGKPAVVTTPTPTRIEGRFSFTGEGMEWSKDMTLSIAGDKLTRTETDPATSYLYTRCTE